MKRLTLLLVLLSLNAAQAKNWPREGTFPMRTHVRTAAITYSSSEPEAARTCANRHDAAIGAGGAFYDTLMAVNPDMRVILYITLSTYRAEDTAALRSFAITYGYNLDDLYASNIGPGDICIEHAGLEAGPGACAPLADPTCTPVGNWISHCGWSEERWVPDFQHPATWRFFAMKALNVALTPGYDGLMQDEGQILNHWSFNGCGAANYRTPRGVGFPWGQCFPVTGSRQNVEGWAGIPDTTIQDSMTVIWGESYHQEITDSLHEYDKLMFINFASYGVVNTPGSTPLVWTGIPGMTHACSTGQLIGEEMFLRPTTPGFAAQAWWMMDTISTIGVSHAMVWTWMEQDDINAVGSSERVVMYNYTWYMMAADTSQFYFMCTKNRENNFLVGDTAETWIEAINYDVGQPDGFRQQVVGSGSVQMWRRDYTQASGADVVILWRIGGGSYNDVSNYSLGGKYFEIGYDGTVGTDTVEVAPMRGAEGRIYVQADPPDPGPGPDTLGTNRRAAIRGNVK